MEAKNLIISGGILFGLGMCFLYYKTSSQSISHSQYKKAHCLPCSTHMTDGNARLASVTNTTMKTILIWNRPEFLFSSLKPTHDGLQKLGCAVDNCIVLDEKSFPLKNYNDVDCILFHTKALKLKNYPIRQRLDQIWVSWLREAPSNFSPALMKKWKDKFNLTYGYLSNTDTDIYAPMGKIIPRPPEDIYELPSKDMVKNKTKMAAWVVSNCRARGQRNNYVKELSKYISVDIYGRCGKLKCSRDPYENCFGNIEKKYKFYLGFESLYCEDYITEKSFRTLQYDIIPVVLGGGNYSRYLAPGSYIDVRDYKSVKHLAEYLHELSNDFDKYLGYFTWKKTRTSIGYNDKGLCDLCEILHNKSYPYKSRFDMGKYFDSKKYCISGKAEAALLHLNQQ